MDRTVSPLTYLEAQEQVPTNSAATSLKDTTMSALLQPQRAHTWPLGNDRCCIHNVGLPGHICVGFSLCVLSLVTRDMLPLDYRSNVSSWMENDFVARTPSPNMTSPPSTNWSVEADQLGPSKAESSRNTGVVAEILKGSSTGEAPDSNTQRVKLDLANTGSGFARSPSPFIRDSRLSERRGARIGSPAISLSSRCSYPERQSVLSGESGTVTPTLVPWNSPHKLTRFQPHLLALASPRQVMKSRVQHFQSAAVQKDRLEAREALRELENLNTTSLQEHSTPSTKRKLSFGDDVAPSAAESEETDICPNCHSKRKRTKLEDSSAQEDAADERQ